MIKNGISIVAPEAKVAVHRWLNPQVEYIKGMHKFSIPTFEHISLDVLRQVLIYLNHPVDTYNVGESIWLEEDYFIEVLYPKIKLLLVDIAKNSPHDLLPFQQESKPVLIKQCLHDISDLNIPVLQASLKTIAEPHSLLDDAFNIVLQLSQVIECLKKDEEEVQEIPLDIIRKLESLRMRLQAFVQNNPVFAISHPVLAASMRNISAATEDYARYNESQALLAAAEQAELARVAREIKPAAGDDESESYDKSTEECQSPEGFPLPSDAAETSISDEHDSMTELLDDLQKQVEARRRSGTLFGKSALEKRNLLASAGLSGLHAIEEQRNSALKSGK